MGDVDAAVRLVRPSVPARSSDARRIELCPRFTRSYWVTLSQENSLRLALPRRCGFCQITLTSCHLFVHGPNKESYVINPMSLSSIDRPSVEFEYTGRVGRL